MVHEGVGRIYKQESGKYAFMLEDGFIKEGYGSCCRAEIAMQEQWAARNKAKAGLPRNIGIRNPPPKHEDLIGAMLLICSKWD